MLASDHGQHVDNFILYVHYLMGVLFVALGVGRLYLLRTRR